MIPHLNALLEMNRRGEMPMDEIVSHVVKFVALQGSKSDYADLPADLQAEIGKAIAWYRETRRWLVVSNTGTEDYSSYADMFLEKVALERSISSHPIAPGERSNRPRFTDAEYERAHVAYAEFKRNGHTEQNCLRCGVGNFKFSETGNSLEIRCETPNCLVERIRGI